jgi:hypothetical protein
VIRASIIKDASKPYTKVEERRKERREPDSKLTAGSGIKTKKVDETDK